MTDDTIGIVHGYFQTKTKEKSSETKFLKAVTSCTLADTRQVNFRQEREILIWKMKWSMVK